MHFRPIREPSSVGYSNLSGRRVVKKRKMKGKPPLVGMGGSRYRYNYSRERTESRWLTQLDSNDSD